MTSSVLARGRACVLGALTLLAGVLVLAGGAGQAHAAGATIWPYASTAFPGDMAFGDALAINQTSGNLLVVDTTNQQFLQIDESGTSVPFTHPALAGAAALNSSNVAGGVYFNNAADIVVDNSGTASQGNFYVVTTAYDYAVERWEYRLWGFRASGEALFDITRPGRGWGLGVAPDGNIWVGLGDRMEELTPAGVPTGPGLDIPAKVFGVDFVAESEFDTAGNMYIYLSGGGRVVRRSPSGVYRILAASVRGLAVDPATGNVLSGSSHNSVYGIDQYGPEGQLEETIGAGLITGNSTVGSLVVSKDGEKLFWLSGQTITVFGPAIRRPEADAAGGVKTTSATLTGVVRPGGAPTTYQFEYGLTKSLGSVPSAPVDAGAGTGPVTASASLTGLKPQTFYYYRLKAIVGGVTVYSPIRSLRTGAPVAVVGGVGDLGPTSASFSGTVDPFDLDGATFHFLVEGVGSPFSTVSAELPVVVGSGPRQVSAAVSGLRPGQQFTVRLVASAGGVTESSAPVSFTTPEHGALPVPPGPSSNLTPYGCGAPAVVAATTSVREGDVVTLRGSDLGVGGTVLVAGARATASSWSSAAVSFAMPEVGAGKVAVSVDCGRASNSVEVTVTAAASSVFRLGAGVVKGSSGAVAVSLPGAGTVVSTGKYLAKSTVKVKKAGSRSVQLRLTAAGKRALARSRSGALKVTARVRYTPTGGSGRTLSKSVTFKRGGSR